MDNIIPDILLITDIGKIIVEIFVTHEIDLEKNVTIYDKETSESIQIPRKQKIQVKATNALRVGMFNVYSGTSIVELTDKYDTAQETVKYLGNNQDLW